MTISILRDTSPPLSDIALTIALRSSASISGKSHSRTAVMSMSLPLTNLVVKSIVSVTTILSISVISVYSPRSSLSMTELCSSAKLYSTSFTATESLTVVSYSFMLPIPSDSRLKYAVPSASSAVAFSRT